VVYDAITLSYDTVLLDTSATHAIVAPIRLAHGNSRFEGRVEVYYDGIWGTICRDNWDIMDAR